MNDVTATRFKDYIYYDLEGSKNCGRIVYIDPNLIKPMFDNILSMNKPGLATRVVEDLGLLKNQAGDINSNSNQLTPGLHRSNFGSVQVTYTIVQENDETNRGPGVYISNVSSIDIGPGGEQEKVRAGLHLMKGSQTRWIIGEPIDEIETYIGALLAVR